jgi:6-phosphogluconolactonase (cycloisomerase 2 family)
MMTADLRQTGASPCFLLVLDDLPFTCNKDTAVNQREKTSAPSQGKEQGEKGTDTNQGKECGCETLCQTDPKHPNAAGHFLMTADYTGGSVSVFPIKDGRLDSLCCQLKFEGNGPVVKRQQSSHIHQLRELPEIKGVQGKYILATDLGADAIRLLKVIPGCDKPLQTGTQTPGCTNTPGSFCPIVHMTDIPCPAGSGPRHMEFSKDLKTLYCIAELSGDVLVYSISEKQGEPAFEMIQKIQADEVNAGGSADIHLHPSGKYLYTSHRLDNDGIAIFRTNDDGTLEKIGYTRTARHPRNFMITQDGRHLLVACRDDQVIQTFTIGKDGSLTLLPQVLRFENDKPSSITAIQR